MTSDDTEFAFEAIGALHFSGSKYYQVIRIANRRANLSVVVTHWGKTHPGAPKEPKHHGQCKVVSQNGTGLTAYSAARKMKSSRGYEGWKDTFSYEEMGEDYLKGLFDEWFDPVKAGEIFKMLVPREVSIKEIDKEEALTELDDASLEVPIGRVKDTFVASSTKREDWGSW